MHHQNLVEFKEGRKEELRTRSKFDKNTPPK
jgi:hypothetical protein